MSRHTGTTTNHTFTSAGSPGIAVLSEMFTQNIHFKNMFFYYFNGGIICHKVFTQALKEKLKNNVLTISF